MRISLQIDATHDRLASWWGQLAERRKTAAFRGLAEMERDRTDKRILALLEKNARMTASAIGREIGLSRTAVQDRMARMETDGVIRGYQVVASDAGAGLARALLFVEIADRPCDRALRWLASLPGVTAVHSLAGDIDAVVHVSLPSAAELSDLNDMIGSSPAISRARSQVILRSF
jgi:Lrp/AsnC family leucine-responsive transcriptional regulator